MSKKAKVTAAALGRMFDEVEELVLRKNIDYGDAWQETGIGGVMVRLMDKTMRVERLHDGKQFALVIDERVEDTLLDIMGYAALGLLWLRAQYDGKD